MRVIVAGLGVQGKKRVAIAGDRRGRHGRPGRARGTVYGRRAGAARVTTTPPWSARPTAPSRQLLRYLLDHGKHVLVEKPMPGTPGEIGRLGALARSRGVACYTAYNHRFEPHIARLKQVLEAGTLGPGLPGPVLLRQRHRGRRPCGRSGATAVWVFSPTSARTCSTWRSFSSVRSRSTPRSSSGASTGSRTARATTCSFGARGMPVLADGGDAPVVAEHLPPRPLRRARKRPHPLPLQVGSELALRAEARAPERQAHRGGRTRSSRRTRPGRSSTSTSRQLCRTGGTNLANDALIAGALDDARARR